jgi:hypothetical protein
LPAEVLNVARQLGSGNGFEKRGELRADGGGARRKGLE